MDVIYLGLLALCGVAMWGFVRLCGRLEKNERQEGAK